VEVVSSKFFVGLPIPGGAGMIATTVLFFHDWSLTPWNFGVPLLISTYLLGFVMVSTLPYYSFKEVEFVKSKPVPVLVLAVVLVTVVAVSPGTMLFLLTLAFVSAGPLTYLYKWHGGTLNSNSDGREIQKGSSEVDRPALSGREGDSEETKP
jgi:CDP-diacylglycerol---serine O-phosphatidyltransferase